MRNATLLLVIKDGKILLGMKKRGFGKGKYNGFGGKVSDGESIEEATIRETGEESRLKFSLEDLIKVAEIDFFFPELKKDWNQRVHIYLASEYSGVSAESEEMAPEWFNLNQIPYAQMWETDSHWLPIVLSGKNLKEVFILMRIVRRQNLFLIK